MFFFFKQKTAYEMRISDWSSDVCSSDLGRGCRGCCATAPGSASRRRRRLVETGHVVDVLAVAGDTERTRQRVVHQAVDGDEAQAAGTGPGAHLLEIGRASCRARVWQYV